jgi:hypothetical protein
MWPREVPSFLIDVILIVPVIVTDPLQHACTLICIFEWRWLYTSVQWRWNQWECPYSWSIQSAANRHPFNPWALTIHSPHCHLKSRALPVQHAGKTEATATTYCGRSCDMSNSSSSARLRLVRLVTIVRKHDDIWDTCYLQNLYVKYMVCMTEENVRCRIVFVSALNFVPFMP